MSLKTSEEFALCLLVCNFLILVNLISYDGSCSAESENYKASLVACQTLLDTVILQDPRELRLSAYLRIAHRKARGPNSIHNYSEMDLVLNHIREARPELPEFVKEKIALLESRRDWSNLTSEVCGRPLINV